MNMPSPAYQAGKICYVEIPATDPGLLVYIMVASAAAAVDAVVAAGGEIVQPIDPNAQVVVATFRDPAGNVLGIYQEPSLAGG